MTTVIKVEPAFTLNRHRTFEEAIAKGRSTNTKDLELINGRALDRFQFDGSSLVLSFDNGMSLSMSVGNKKIEWNILAGDSVLCGQAPENIIFELPSGNRFAWNWKRTLRCFVGKTISVKPSDQLMFVHVLGCGDYVVSAYVEVSSPNRRFLDISDE